MDSSLYGRGPEFLEKKNSLYSAEPDLASLKRWRRGPDAPVVATADYVAGMARRIESQIASDWHFLPAVWNLHMRHAALSAPLSLMNVTSKPRQPHDVASAALLSAAQGIFKQLERNTYVVKGQTRQLDGDVMKLLHDDKLSPDQRDLLMSYKAATKALPGTQQIRYSIGHAMFGYRVVLFRWPRLSIA